MRSCGQMVNGVPALACHTFLRDCLPGPGPVRVEPLQHIPILRDLVIAEDGAAAAVPRPLDHGRRPGRVGAAVAGAAALGGTVKRSHEPVFWAWSGAGGMLAALLGPVLVFVTGSALPLHWLRPQGLCHADALALPQHALGRVALLVVTLFLLHACHRLLHSLHDLGLHTGTAARRGFYGFAAAGSLLAAALLFSL